MLRQQRRILCVRRHGKRNEKCRVRQQAPLANGIGGRKKVKSEGEKKLRTLVSFQAFDVRLNNLGIGPGPVLGAIVSFHFWTLSFVYFKNLRDFYVCIFFLNEFIARHYWA